MSLQRIDLTTALRPSLLPDETLLFVQDAVGLYEGKYKIPNCQNGHAYLTSHRACYVDNEEPRKNSVAVALRDAGFLKSSPKVTLHFKPSRRSSVLLSIPSRSGTSSPLPRTSTPVSPLPPPPASQPASAATWICPICSFSNPVPSNFDPAFANANTPLPPCLACGIKPPLAHVLKAAISNAAGRSASIATSQPAQPKSTPLEPYAQSDTDRNGNIDGGSVSDPALYFSAEATFHCPRCTFANHPSLLSCEMCGASLVSSSVPAHLLAAAELHRSESPGPSLNTLGVNGNDTAESVKFSFRAGGEKAFYERLKGAMVQRKWLLQNAPPIPKPNRLTPSDVIASEGASSEESQGTPERKKVIGIAGLERRGVDMRKNNELVIGNAFEDLEALMGSAKEIVALAESFASKLNTTTGGAGGVEANTLLSESATALGLVTTKDMLAGTGSASESLYLSELARNLAEFLTDDAQGVLKREGGIMSLVDLWAVFNRARGGVELVSPMDFEKAAGLWEKLKLPVRLRRFRSGLLVVQGRERTDEKTIASLLDWLKGLHSAPGGYVENLDSHWEMELYGRGVTAQETAENFGWSVGVASEELEMAEERGALCRDEGVEGVRFWENWIVNQDDLPIRFFLILVFTTPPTPNAGKTLTTLAAQLIPQSLATFLALSLHATLPARLYKSSPHRWNGVLTTCIAAGHANCATSALLMCFSLIGNTGASMAGRLNDAKIVMESRAAKRAYVGKGTARAGMVAKRRAKVRSLNRQSAMFVPDVKKNFEGPAVTVCGGWEWTVEEKVSRVLAAR
ncbi:hypothetical protein FGG08_006670 [Glutinoglossum americanum]|uniref:Vacuolar protein-sorting-associated protein 36 n=1 Tax=Glutinoglossum americanum TaxID=1670608 RepID=A0A9P8L045_9PEZI|nr:hypothetical protein FGG08_006670 [Glutinoglossum americanum]